MPATDEDEMIYHYDEDYVKWAEQWGLNIHEFECRDCGKKCKTDLPYSYGTWRGLVARDHGCPEEAGSFTAAESDPKEKEDWKKIFKYLSEEAELNDETLH